MKYERSGICMIVTDDNGRSFPVIIADLTKQLTAYKARQKQQFDRDQAEIDKLQMYIDAEKKLPKAKR